MTKMKAYINVKNILRLVFLLTMLAGWQTIVAQTDTVKWNINDGNLIIPASSNKHYVIYGSTTVNRVVVDSGFVGGITLQNLSIKHTSRAYSAITILGKYNQSNRDPVTKVTITLDGNNEIFRYGSGDYCCIEVKQGSQIHLKAIDENNDLSGKLTAKILLNTVNDTIGNSSGGGAAIGSRIYPYYPNDPTRWSREGNSEGVGTITAVNGDRQGNKTVPTAGGNIIVSSGTYDLLGGHGAGIGGGFKMYYNGMIVIYGGDIFAKSWRHSAGIGSGCPLGSGVEYYYTPNSAVIVLPPAKIEAYGATASEGIRQPNLALSGTNTLIYVNDPNKPELTIHTEDYEPEANIYADMTANPTIVDIFSVLQIPYQVNAGKFGTTSKIGTPNKGKLVLNAQLDQPITFFTDKSSSGLLDPAMQGRPYLPKTVTIPAGTNANKHDIELEFLPIEIFMDIFAVTSKPLIVGYTEAEAKEKAYHVKIYYKDNDPMTDVLFELESGTDFGPLIFLAADSSTVIPPPQTLSNGMIFYVIVPMKHGRPINNYLDVLAISGEWQGVNTGKIRKIAEQKVVLDDTDDNKYIKVTANPATAPITDPATDKVRLTLNIDHTGLPFSYNPADVQARYIITTEANYDAAVAKTPVDQWPYMNIPTGNGVDAITDVYFTGMTSGTYYIHWFVISGLVHAHSKTVVNPPALYGGFGPYVFVGLNDDLISMFEYGSVGINIFDNDDLMPSTLTSISSALDLITQYPKAGELIDNGHQLIYQHTNAATLTHDIDSFAYSMTIGGKSYTAKAYIYAIRSSNGGFAAKKDNNYTINLLGTDVEFKWYNSGGTLLSTSPTHTISNIQADTRLGVAPKRTASPYKDLQFPIAPLTVKVFTGTPTMRWTGAINTDWHNPGNWTQIVGNTDMSVSWIPSADIDVIIPSNVPNYPMLGKNGACNDIEMQDRAMLAGIHYLTYNGAKVEIQLTSSEKDRFIMWSAPLESMYSGDYHYKNSADQIQHGDVFMNLFQHANPAGGIGAESNSFTATFGELGEPLPLGKAFNVKVTSTSDNYDKPFVFPQGATTYIDADNTTYNLTRTNGSKFITDNRQALDSNSTFNMNVANDIAGSTLMQIVNPYMAYLDITKFLQANSSILGNSYAIWNGDVDQSFVQEISGPVGEGNRYTISTTGLLFETTGLISPLQSFFVTKKTTAKISTVKMSPTWATTVGPNPYELRSSTEDKEKNILRIKVSQNTKSSYAVIHNDPTASQGYSSDKDMYKLFYDAISLEVYAITSSNEPLAIYSVGDFSNTIKLGVSTKEEGEVVLNFDRITGFGHDVYLIDNMLKGANREIDLQKHSSYTFTARRESNTNGAIEINDRFSLRFVKNAVGIENIDDSSLRLTQQDGVLHIKSVSGIISLLHIYNVDGTLVYSNTVSSDLFKASLPKQQTYVVKAIIEGKEFVQKVFIK